MPPRRVLFLASGTRGDVEPAAALARALGERGLQVRFATHESFRPLAEEAGLDVAALPANPTDILLRVCNALSLLGGPVAAVLDTRRYVRAARPLYTAIAAAALPLMQAAEAVVVGLPTIWLLPIAAACGARPICAFLQPLTRSSLEPSAVAPRLPRLGVVTRVGHWALEQAVWQPWRPALARWCREAGLAPLPAGGPFAEIYRRRLPVLYGFSESVVPRPPDWPSEHVITGYWHAAEKSGAAAASACGRDAISPASPATGVHRLRQPRRPVRRARAGPGRGPRRPRHSRAAAGRRADAWRR